MAVRVCCRSRSRSRAPDKTDHFAARIAGPDRSGKPYHQHLAAANTELSGNSVQTEEEEEEKEEKEGQEIMENTLPSPRSLLTSLIEILASQPIPPREQQTQPATSTSRPQSTEDRKPSNPLSLLPPYARTLLTTLHVIYPSLLLPALDLLDRGLATRVLVLGASDAQGPDEAEQARRDAKLSTFYLVRSAQQLTRRGRRPGADGGEGGPAYVVRTRAWSCDCAAFAFNAFPAESSPAAYQTTPEQEGSSDAPTAWGVGRWEFGALSFDGRGGEDGVVGSGTPPCCKHLLACVLAERWGAVLGGYIQERRASREEAAGVIGSL